MRRILPGLLFALAAAALAAACDDGDHHGREQGNGDPCNQVTSCETCTPIQGCGWCTFADGTGACASDPDECANVTGVATFTWAWEPSGCRVGADASVGGGDGAASEASASVSPGDAGGGDADAAPTHAP